MAAVSISPLPLTLSAMSGRRVPLSNNTNAANSPYRAVAAAAAQKQKRSYATVQREESYGQPPAAKKQILDSRQVLRTPPRVQHSQPSAEGKVFTRRSNGLQQTEFERKCVAVSRERAVQKPAQRAAKEDQIAEENLETMQTWRKHTRRSFPKFVFYFENIPSDTHSKCAKQINSLGAVSMPPWCMDRSNIHLA
jgi:regulatory subunit for Cdc7p protein kinase